MDVFRKKLQLVGRLCLHHRQCLLRFPNLRNGDSDFERVDLELSWPLPFYFLRWCWTTHFSQVSDGADAHQWWHQFSQAAAAASCLSQTVLCQGRWNLKQQYSTGYMESEALGQERCKVSETSPSSLLSSLPAEDSGRSGSLTWTPKPSKTWLRWAGPTQWDSVHTLSSLHHKTSSQTNFLCICVIDFLKVKKVKNN